MSKENNIVLISSNEDFSEKIAEKIILLRQTDNIITAGYQNALKTVLEYKTTVVILHADTYEKTINLIKELKEYSPIILLTSDNNIILDAYDAGITDFCSTAAPDYELVIRIVNCIKTAVKNLNIARCKRLLVQNSLLDKDSGFYLYKIADKVINNEILTRGLETGTFVVLAPAEKSNPIFSNDKIIKAIKQSIREDDIVTFGKGAKFYLLLPYTDINNSLKVVEKIQKACPENFEIKAGICDIAGKDFTQLEQEGLKAVLDSMYSPNTCSVAAYQEETLNNWLEEDISEPNNYKLFNHIFRKKLEKVIIPVFYRLQKAYEEKMPDAEIFQYADENKCVFHIKNKVHDSILKIVYPGFAKIVIYIIHKGLDSPENTEITLSLSKITAKDLTQTIEDFIKEFNTISVK